MSKQTMNSSTASQLYTELYKCHQICFTFFGKHIVVNMLMYKSHDIYVCMKNSRYAVWEVDTVDTVNPYRTES